MEFFVIFESIIFHHSKALRPDPFKEQETLPNPEFLKDRLTINGMDIVDGKRFGGLHSDMECSPPVHILQLEEGDLIKK